MDKTKELHFENCDRIAREKLNVWNFSWDDILPYKLNKRSARKKVADNGSAFIHWVIGTLRKYVSELPPKKKYNALCIYMNEKNIKFLNGQLDPWVWLDVAPKCCGVLQDDEFGVDTDDILLDI